jgi:hypothetical protein
MPGKKAPTPPPHIAIFTRFSDSTSSRLEALIAFGIFTESERDGAFDMGESYSEDIDRLFASNRNFCLNEARQALLQAAFAAIEEKKTEIAEAHKGFRGWGVWEAFIGALAWSAFLILFGLGSVYVKPDLLEIPRHVIEQLRQGQPHQ